MTEKTLTPMKAIRAKCLDCCCGSANEVRLCPASSCPLQPYRFGRNPYRAPMTEDQRKARADNFKKARQAKNSA